MDFVNDRIAVGSGRLLTLWNLKRYGITHVINVRHKQDRKSIRYKLWYLHAPTVDDGLDKPSEYWDGVAQYALQVLQNPETKIYVHCRAGVNRGPGMTYAILRALGHTRIKAWTMVTDARPQAKDRYVDNIG